MKINKQIESNHKYHTERINGQTVIKDDTLADQKKQRKEKNIGRIKSVASNPSGLFGSIIIILVAVSLIRVLYGGMGTVPTFQSLLDVLQRAPQVSTSIKNFVQQLQFVEPWAILDGLRMFLNSLVQIISIGVWMASSLFDVISFIIYFLIWIFI